MKRQQLSEADLRRELEDWRERYPRLKYDELFVAWFLRAFVTEADEDAVKALTGGSGDKDVDAVYIDDNAKIVFVVQGKYRKNIWGKAEHRADVKSFAELAVDLCGDDSFFESRATSASPIVQQRLRDARARTLQRGYRLCLYYVTLGKVTNSVRQEAQSTVRRYGNVASAEIFDGRRVLLILSDYLDGVAPPVPLLDLPMESSHGGVSNALSRRDNKTEIESWVFSMAGESVAELFDRAGIRLFARNVRGYLGSTDINASMQATLEHEPSYFWYYNNGITIVCDRAERVTSGGNDVLRATNPQIINGQQTTRVLHERGIQARRASVLVRVMQVPREAAEASNDFESLVSNIVQATNWQNAIRPSDLMSNDPRQIAIERSLRKLGYLYLRKRQTKGEARRNAVAVYPFIIKKEEIAQAVAGCELDPAIVRAGREQLFEEPLYDDIFRNADPGYYLSRYWLHREVSAVARGDRRRVYAKWLVLHFIWPTLAPICRSRSGAEAFRLACERRDTKLLAALSRSIDATFVGALRFFREHQGSGRDRIDAQTFFKRRNLHNEFDVFWRSPQNSFKERFQKGWNKFEQELRAEMAR